MMSQGRTGHRWRRGVEQGGGFPELFNSQMRIHAGRDPKRKAGSVPSIALRLIVVFETRSSSAASWTVRVSFIQ